MFVEFNAWLYQGYDDARAALMEEIASKINAIAEEKQTATDKAKNLLKRVDWFRTTKFFGGTAVPLMMGLPPLGLLKELEQISEIFTDESQGEEIKGKIDNITKQTNSYLKGFLKPKSESTPPKEIKAIRDSFEETLKELGITLIVLIDDLDRCLPGTTISTLEAIRLFLFLRNTAFVIAADDKMIKHAVRKHFNGIDDDLVTNYFDKLIQVPIRVPTLGTQEVRAYMMLLFIDNSDLKKEDKDEIRKKICSQLGSTWEGKRVDYKFLESLGKELPAKLISQLETVERLAPIMITSTNIRGNPRLIKRFLNALSIRLSMAKSNGITVAEEVVAKMLLFERCGSNEAYESILKQVMESQDGKSVQLKELEEKLILNTKEELPDQWNDNFHLQWLQLKPSLGDVDLRGVLYLSREHIPVITPEDILSSKAVDLMKALLESPQESSLVKDDLEGIQSSELSHIMKKLLERARDENEWGAPPILDACLTVSKINSSVAKRFAAFLSERPPKQIKPSIVPKIQDEDWAKEVFQNWKTNGVAQPVIKAIDRVTNGNL